MPDPTAGTKKTGSAPWGPLRQMPMFPELHTEEPITPAMLQDLAKLEKAGPNGLAKYGTAWSSFGLRIGPRRHVFLTNRGLARVNTFPRTPRLVITAAGSRALADSKNKRLG